VPFDNVILDFDGTIADSRRDIARAQLWAMAQVGAPPRREEELYPLIGLPLEETFRRLLPAALHGKIGDAAVDVLAGKNAGSATRPDFIIDEFPALESVVL